MEQVIERNIGKKTNSRVAKLKEKIYAEYQLSNDDVFSFYSYNYERSLILGKARKVMRGVLLFAIAIELLK